MNSNAKGLAHRDTHSHDTTQRHHSGPNICRLFGRFHLGKHVQQGLAIGRIDLFCFGFGKRPEGERHVLHPVRMILPDQNLISVLDLTDCCLC